MQLKEISTGLYGFKKEKVSYLSSLARIDKICGLGLAETESGLVAYVQGSQSDNDLVFPKLSFDPNVFSPTTKGMAMALRKDSGKSTLVNRNYLWGKDGLEFNDDGTLSDGSIEDLLKEAFEMQTFLERIKK